ncbi:hypothetical protein DMH08_30745 [Actinomadura sp. WAC 06369]|nr:hypothetical protein DMH08_30745 [Actinomadura sp. WAC 06369]
MPTSPICSSPAPGTTSKRWAPSAARSYFQRSLTTAQRLHGPDHPDTLISRNNLAYAYQAVAPRMTRRERSPMPVSDDPTATFEEFDRDGDADGRISLPEFLVAWNR